MQYAGCRIMNMPLKTTEEVSLASYPNLSDKVYDIIKGDILSGRAEPGTKLQVVELARRLRVSRTPVKDALSRIAMEGFVRDVPRKGYFVLKRDSEDIVELLDARLMLELVAVERGLPLLKRVDVEQMSRLLGQIDGIVDDQGRYIDYEEFVEKDFQFHLLTVSTARNRHLLDVYRYLFLHLNAARIHHALAPGYRRAFETKREHKAIVDAFESQDLSALKEAITRHVQESTKSFLAAQARMNSAATAYREVRESAASG
jgi:DNA-binding GntR family transcriptional regulator